MRGEPEYIAKLFQSTPPREGGDGYLFVRVALYPAFQSTPPARGATPR